MVRGQSGARRLESSAPAEFPELRRRHLGPQRGRRTFRTRRTTLEEHRQMILAGDIGGTNARLALFDVRNGQFNLVSATIFPSRRYSSLDKIVTEFVRASGVRPALACFGVAGPVTNGRVETSNLPWTIESRRLADELNLKSTTLINDLEATGWGIAALSGEDLVPLNNIAAKNPGNQCIVAAGTGLGEGGLYWDGTRHH